MIFILHNFDNLDTNFNWFNNLIWITENKTVFSDLIFKKFQDNSEIFIYLSVFDLSNCNFDYLYRVYMVWSWLTLYYCLCRICHDINWYINNIMTTYCVDIIIRKILIKFICMHIYISYNVHLTSLIP